jgi:hypothetical protein
MDFNLNLSIYAAVISTIVFVWRLYEFYYDRKSKLSVRITQNTKIPVSNNLKFGESQMYLTTTIINIGKPRRMIEEPIFLSNKKVNNQKYFNFLSFSNVVKYPIALASGEKYEYEVTNNVIEDLKVKGITKIKAVVMDTHGKSHYSKWYEI